jgi:flagellin-like hook-associated protein FlgL
MTLSANIPGSTLIARHSALSAENDAERALERLASGVRVNNAGDDAAGLAIAQRHNANILGMAGAVRNSANTQSLLAVADGALAAATNGLIRINELAAAAANPVVGAQELKMIQSEIDQLIKELDQTSDRTTFNNTALLNGGFKNQRTLVNSVDQGAITFSLPEVSASALGAYVFYADGVAARAASTSAATNPVTTAEDITIKGSMGTYTFSAINEEPAENLAARINAQTEATGVTAEAKTEALLRSANANIESIRLLINGVATRTFDLSSTHLAEAAETINAMTAQTDVSAEVSDSGIRLIHKTGGDITIENMEASTSLSVQKIAANGVHYVGPAVTLQASGNNDSTRVSGTLLLSSSESFGVSEAGATATENMVIQTDATVSHTLGDVSIVNGFIYVGNGAGADAIGNVDITQNGQAGQPLKINLGQFGNNDFETGNAGDTTISGWSVTNSQVKLNGASTLGGQATATDTTFPGTVAAGFAAPYDQMTPTAASYSTSLSSDTSSGTGLSVKLRSYDVRVDRFGILHGPAIVSDSSVELHPGDSVSFEWRASGGDDAYDVIGYLVDENTGHIEEILNETGADANASTSWATVTRNITTSGTYKFVFVAGTWDATGGRWAGAQLYIDNIDVTQNSKQPLSNDIVEQIRTALTSSRNGYLQPVSVVSTGDELRFTLDTSNVAQLIPINTLDLLARDGKTMARTLVTNSLNQITAARADLGALHNRLDSASDAAMAMKASVSAAKGDILDADYALESARYARARVLQETSTSLLAKTNNLNEVVLDLLRDD